MKEFNPQIEIFDPFKMPFSDLEKADVVFDQREKWMLVVLARLALLALLVNNLSFIMLSLQASFSI